MTDRRGVMGLTLGLLAAPSRTWLSRRGRYGELTDERVRELPGSNPGLAPLSQGLRELGYVEGRNVTMEIRYAEGADGAVSRPRR